MPANYEFNIDHGVIEVCAWDLVTLSDLTEYLGDVTATPNDLSNTIEYVDLGQATELNVSQLGALQIASSYERLIDRGIRGSVIYAPSDQVYEAAKTMIATFVAVAGDLPDGYRLTRTPLAIGEVHAFLLGSELMEIRLVA